MNSAYDNYIISAIKELPETQVEFLQLKKKLSKQYSLPLPTNADLRDRYNTLVKEKKVAASKAFEAILLSRAIRTQSGVAVVAVLTKSYPCPGKCIYCPTEKDMPKSYLSNEPAVMRAIDSHFDPYLQVQNRLRSLEINGHKTDKIELIVMGGTFSFLPKAYQKKFITRCFQAANEYPRFSPFGKGGSKGDLKNKLKFTNPSQPPFSKGRSFMDEILLKEQKKNEKAKHRIIGLTLETRPDYIDEEEIVSFRNLGCTRVELGVQSIYDDVLELNKRGHLVSETIRATKLLKDAGFKINFHMMPGLPGSTPARDFKMFKQLFESQDFQPDMLKIYPTVVLKDSILYNMWKKGQYKPLSNKTFEKLVLRIKNETITPYVRIARLVRDVPTSSIIAGPTISNLRQIIIPQSKCPCIRCREVREGYLPRLAKAIARRREAGEVENEIILDRIDYTASDGKEIFLQYVSKKNNPSLSFPPLNKGRARVGSNDASNQKLFALLRLRIPSIFCHSERNEADNGGRMQSKNLGPDLSTSSRSAELNFAQDDIEKIDNEKLYELFPVLKNSALIREVHTYGKLTQIDKQNSSSPQHIGLGKKLLIEAERISKEEFGLNKIVVISGVGVRGYYKKSGYKLRDTYMVKSL